MTKRQYKICSAINRTKDVKTVLKKFDIPDTDYLQYEVDPKWLDFDSKLTKVWLDIPGQQAYEDYQRGLASDRKATIALIIAVLSLILSGIAIILQYLR